MVVNWLAKCFNTRTESLLNQSQTHRDSSSGLKNFLQYNNCELKGTNWTDQKTRVQQVIWRDHKRYTKYLRNTWGGHMQVDQCKIPYLVIIIHIERYNTQNRAHDRYTIDPQCYWTGDDTGDARRVVDATDIRYMARRYLEDMICHAGTYQAK